ncbi:site-specific DNA-methyltransferase [Pseudomonas sp. SD17-1]|uniref:site-specific DNA-methyltransferase n=1 Tax=Pseudomonas TaxID=286 RepID=UPI00168B5BDD|nr:MULTISPECIES: site-specific DNA-methyltransferase [Pseudomonas]QNL87478.1 Site-specific DNA-methyltransferase [Pseudomonas putida]WEJ19839.1 site-specific DNA-methyltransferase [Pseudomonas sp. SD17-1]
MSKQKDQFIALLGELFQLNQPELDFGLYRILHARSAQIKTFIDTELGSEIDAHFAGQSQSNAHDALEAARVKVAETLGEDAFLPTGELKPEYRGTKVGKEFELAQQHARDGGGVLADDAQVYEHLYRFFSRYYDKGDFMSKRYFVAENDSRAAPYAVPYDGREVMLHWANKDQYYIKSSEALSNFTFDLTAAQAKERGPQSGFDFQPAATTPLKVHFRLAAAAEGEHNNVKEGQERFFIIHATEPLKLETNDKGLPELVVQFDYRPDSTKTGQAGTWQQKRLAEAEQIVGEQLANLVFPHPELRAFEQPLFAPAPTDKQPTRTLLGKYLGQFTARNTMDYFIHKNLGGFLRRELDFYIKNEIIRLDDIEAADVPRVDEYLKKLRVLRKIARRIVDFLAQLEDFQKKLWLKKKFVVETQYCITLDRIPESFYAEIAANEQQREEWVKLFAIDEIKDSAQSGYSTPLTINFLKENQFLVIDTRLFPEPFKYKLVSSLDKLDENTTGNLLHSDNQQGLNLISEKFKKEIDCIFIDPPYNTGNDGFIYKDAYCHSSWLSFARSRIEAAKPLLSDSSYFGATIDFVESSRLRLLLDEIFGEDSFLADIAWEKRYTRSNNAKKFYSLKDQLLVYGNVETFKERRTESSLENYSNPDKDPRGDWISSSYVNPATREARPNLSYEIVNPYTQEEISHPTHAWKYDKQVYLQHVQDNRLYWGESGDYTYPRLKSFLSDASENMVPVDIWKHQDTGTTDAGGAELKNMFGKSVFDNPKPTSLISRFVRLVADNKEPRQIIDFFAGSGSTGHALINLSRQACNKKYILIEMGAHFDSVLKPRLQKSIYSKDWSEGKPVSREGISHCLKYIRLESFEDTLNNLQLPDTPRLNTSSPESAEMTRDYLLKYWLEFETAGSPSLLNVREFTDPTSYRLKVKQPGSDAQVEKTIDLVETFNWLIGLHVAHLDQPRRYAIELVREADPELPKDQDTRWRSTAIKERDDGEFWFRAVEGHILSVPGDDLSRERVLVIWRKLTGDSGRDQAALEAWLNKRGINPRESEYAFIYVNGNHALPSDGDAATRVRLIEETFAQRMWENA